MARKRRGKAPLQKKRNAPPSPEALLPDVINEIPEEFRKTLGNENTIKFIALIMRSQHHSGPLPAAEQFKIYNDTHPNAAERILEYMEKEQSHRHTLKHHATSEVIRGQLFGFFIMLCLMGGAIYSIYKDNKWGIIAFLGVAACGVVSKFIDGSKKH